MARSLHTSTSRKDAPPGYSTDTSVGPMLRFEKSLPNLPVPSISSTAAKYLETVRPHLTDPEYAETRKAVDEFVSSPHVAELQKRLQKRAEGTDSWLIEWWNDVAYMGYRESCLFRQCRGSVNNFITSGDPVVVFVSYFYVYLDDKSRKTPEKRAASLLKSLLAFRELVES
jgi:carnitine O-acetyltransferase